MSNVGLAVALWVIAVVVAFLGLGIIALIIALGGLLVLVLPALR